MPCYKRRAPLRMPCYKRRAPGSVRIASMGNARATLSRGGVQANDPRIHMHVCVRERLGDLVTDRSRAARLRGPSCASLLLVSLRFYVYHTQQGDQKCPPQSLGDSLFFSRSPEREGQKGGKKRHAAMAEGTDGRDSAGRE